MTADNRGELTIYWIKETRCPACGNETLFLGFDSRISCSWHDCPNPDYNEAQRSWHEQAVAEQRKVAWYAGHAQGVEDTEARLSADRLDSSNEPTDRPSEDGSLKEDV